MEELINELIKENVNVESVLKQFISLSDEEILIIFNHDKINISVKGKLLEKAYERINKLNRETFIEVLSWLEESKGLENYLKRIEKMTYKEFVEFLYNGVYSEKVMLSLTESNIYKKYLEEEKTKELGISIQIIALEKELSLVDNNVKKLDTIGTEIIKLVNQSKEETDSLVNFFLNKVIENMDIIQNESECLKSALEIVKMQMRNHEILTPKMIEFYLYFRVKELNISDICQHIIVTLGYSEVLAYYVLEDETYKNGILKIDYERLMNEFKDYKDKLSKKDYNDTVNQNIFPMLSHELKHTCAKKEYLEKIDGKNIASVALTNKFVNAEIRQQHLKQIIGKKGYRAGHDTFINEARADIFSYFDANKQFLKYFKECYDAVVILKMVSFFAQCLIKKYTNKEGNFLSPMEQFNTFYNENIKEIERIPIVEEEENDMFNALLNGEPIPIELYEILKKIASGEIITDDLEATLKTFIQAINSLKEETVNQSL